MTGLFFRTGSGKASKLDNTVFVILGRKGSGKSFLAAEIIEEYPRAIILDSLAEYSGDVVTDGLPDSVREILKRKDKPRFRIVCRVLDKEHCEKLMRLIYEIPNTLFVIEETSMYCSPTYLPEDLSRLIQYGRHREISLMFISRRPAELNRNLTAQADLVVTFQQQEPRDVQYLRGILGKEADQIVGLQPYQFIMMGQREKAPLCLLSRETKSSQLTLFKNDVAS